MNVYVVIPYFSNGIEVNGNDVKVFLTYESASKYANSKKFEQYDIVHADYSAQ